MVASDPQLPNPDPLRAARLVATGWQRRSLRLLGRRFALGRPSSMIASARRRRLTDHRRCVLGRGVITSRLVDEKGVGAS
jgi:hypothetical protein